MATTRLLELYRAAPSRVAAVREVPAWAPPPIPPPNPWDDTALGYSVGIDGMIDVETGVTISAKDRCEHTLLLGKTGQGKSNMLLKMIAQDA